MIVVRGALSDATLAALRERYAVFCGADDDLPPADRSRIRALVTWGMMRTDRALLARFPNLGLVCCTGSGFEGVDLAAASERRILVSHGPGANASSVADLAMALLLASMRRIVAGDAFVRTGGWRGNDQAAPEDVPGVTGKRIGIYGLGEIGRRVAHRAAAFEMEVGYHGRTLRADVPYPYFPTLLALATWADALVIAVRATHDTAGAVDSAILSALGPEGHLVNVARGSVVDEPALVEALRDGRIAGAGLDVFAHEPDVPDALTRSDRVVLTPHLGSATVAARRRMDDLLLANLDAFVAGRPIVTPVPGMPASFTRGAGD